MSPIAIHPSWVQVRGIYQVTQDLYDKGLNVTAPRGRKYFEAVPTQPKVETLADEILREMRRG
jgi:hypothetical protein